MLLHGTRNRRYKVYFAIDAKDQVVQIFHVRHWARKPAEVDELQELADDDE